MMKWALGMNQGIGVLVVIAGLRIGAFPHQAYAGGDAQVETGRITGQLVDAETKIALAGASVVVVGTVLEQVTDQNGNFALSELPVGTYSLTFSYPEMLPLTKTDIVVKSRRTTALMVEYRLVPLVHEDVTVTAGYFTQVEEQPTSAINFSSEEIRRAPGSAGDVSRIVFGLPSIAKVNDMMNSLVVRGGNPSENTFFVDNIELPNINHFPMQGTSGGPIGLLNVDFIRDVSFYSGGFSSIYGDRLSSVMDIAYRDGNRERREAQASLDFAGAGMAIEGPLASKGSYMFSARKSYLDLLVGAIGTGVAPRYGDAQGKVSFDFSERTKLTVLGLAGIDDYGVAREDAIDSGDDNYVNTHSREGTVGLNWFRIWGPAGYSNTSVSHNFTTYDTKLNWTRDASLFMDNASTEQYYTVRNVNHFSFSPRHRVSVGMEAKRVQVDYDLSVAEYTDVLGHVQPASARKLRSGETKWSGFVDYSVAALPSLTVNVGLRTDYFSYGSNFHASPRLSFSYALDRRTSLTGAAGVFYQQLPLMLLYRSDGSKDLKDPVAYHFVLGVNRLLSPNTRLTVEAYDKEYRDLPVDPTQPSGFIFDDVFGFSFPLRQNVSDIGRAYSRGIEFIIQKKLKERLYGMVSGSWSTSRYRGYDGVWRNRQFDNRYIVSVEGGYKRSRSWEYSLRWILAGGRPYTPFDLDASRASDTEILDVTRTNAERLPAYHSLNVRFDRRFYFGHSNLTLYLSVWNAYNRKNVADYYWNPVAKKQDTRYQWSVVPVGGLEYEF